jgi:colanic acid biosynthesis glycosyl transferase WcaI
MRILIYGINYAPELTGIGKYTGEMAEWLATNCHDVSVITAMPYYPEWNVHKEFKGKWWFKEIKNGVKIYRCPIYVPKTVNSTKRILHEFSFLLSSSFRWIATLFKQKYDVVICITPPFHIGVFPYLYSKLKKTILVTHIQDLQIDAAKDLNMLKEGFLIKLMLKVEQFLLMKSTYVSTLTNGMKKRILAKGISENKIVMLPNWVDVDKIKVLSKEYSLRKQFNIPLSDIVILYSGNVGKKQGLDVLIDIAKEYESKKNIHFLIIGAGVELNNIKKLVETKNLKNVKFYPLQPYNLLPALLATADLHLVLQKKGASDLVMPSKLTGILAAGGCAIVSAESGTSLYSVISDNNIGFVCEPESSYALKQAIDQALSSNISEIKIKARRYAEINLSQDNIMQSFIQKISHKH